MNGICNPEVPNDLALYRNIIIGVLFIHIVISIIQHVKHMPFDRSNVRFLPNVSTRMQPRMIPGTSKSALNIKSTRTELDKISLVLGSGSDVFVEKLLASAIISADRFDGKYLGFCEVSDDEIFDEK